MFPPLVILGGIVVAGPAAWLRGKTVLSVDTDTPGQIICWLVTSFIHSTTCTLRKRNTSEGTIVICQVNFISEKISYDILEQQHCLYTGSVGRSRLERD